MTDQENSEITALAVAQGWTDIQTSKISGQMHGVDPDGNSGSVPNPMDNDRDAANLEAWCVDRGWVVRYTVEAVASWCGLNRSVTDDTADYSASVYHDEEPDSRRRRRVSLCRAALQTLGGVEDSL